MSMLNDDLVKVVIKNNLERKRRQERILKRQEIRKARNKKRLQVLMIIGLLTVGGITYGDDVVNFVKDFVVDFQVPDDLRMDYLNKRIGGLVMEYDEDVPLSERKPDQTIVAQCTKRTADNRDYYFQHDRIASKILELDPELREYALCAVLNDMGYDMYIKYDGHSTNADSVISYIQSMEKDNEIQLIEDGIETLEDYLKHKGYVDKKGEVSFDAFKESQDKNAEIIKEIVNEYSKGKGI